MTHPPAQRARWRSRTAAVLATLATTAGALLAPTAAEAGYFWTKVCTEGYGNDGVFSANEIPGRNHVLNVNATCNSDAAGANGITASVASQDGGPADSSGTTNESGGLLIANGNRPGVGLIRVWSGASRFSLHPTAGASGWEIGVFDPTDWCKFQGNGPNGYCADAGHRGWGFAEWDTATYNNRWWAPDWPARAGATYGGEAAHNALAFYIVCRGAAPGSGLPAGHCYRSQYREAAGVSFADASVLSVDNTAPTISAARGDIANVVWRKPGAVGFGVTGWDAGTGIRVLQTFVDGNYQADINQPCNWGRLRPCEDRAIDGQQVVVGGNYDGGHTVALRVWDAAYDTASEALNSATTYAAVYTDGTAPGKPVNTDPKPGWKTTNGYELNAAVPATENDPDGAGAQGQSPITTREAQVCPEGTTTDTSKCATSTPAAKSNVASFAYAVPREGRWIVRSRLIDTPGNIGAWSDWTPALLDQTAPVVAVEGAANAIAVRATDTLSGMTGGTTRYRVDGAGEWTTVNGGSVDVPMTPGQHYIEVAAVDAAGNATARTGEGVRFDVSVIDPNAGRTDNPTQVIERAGKDLTAASGGQVIIVDRGAWNGDNASDNAKLTGWFQVSTQPKVKKTAAAKKTAAGDKDATVRKATGVTTRTIKPTQRPVLRGKLVNERGQGIGNARLDLIAEIPGGQVIKDKGGVRTRPNGEWTLVLTKDQTSRKLTLTYRSRVNDEKAVASTSLNLIVTSRVTFNAGPVRVGKPTTFSGSISKRYLPPQGIPVALQYQRNGRWQTFATTNTNSKGQWKVPYKFTRRATWTMRATIPKNAGYAYKTSSSKTRTIRVR